MEGRDSYDVDLTRIQGFDYVTWNDPQANNVFYGEGDCGCRASGHGGQSGVHEEVWRRQSAAAYEMGESGILRAISSAASGIGTFEQDSKSGTENSLC